MSKSKEYKCFTAKEKSMSNITEGTNVNIFMTKKDPSVSVLDSN